MSECERARVFVANWGMLLTGHWHGNSGPLHEGWRALQIVQAAGKLPRHRNPSPPPATTDAKGCAVGSECSAIS